MRKVEIGGIYKHFKGHIYQVIAVAYDTEKYTIDDPNASRLVIYENLETKEVWARPYSMFVSRVDREKYPDCKQTYRFEEYNFEKGEIK